MGPPISVDYHFETGSCCFMVELEKTLWPWRRHYCGLGEISMCEATTLKSKLARDAQCVRRTISMHSTPSRAKARSIVCCSLMYVCVVCFYGCSCWCVFVHRYDGSIYVARCARRVSLSLSLYIYIYVYIYMYIYREPWRKQQLKPWRLHYFKKNMRATTTLTSKVARAPGLL